MHYGQIVGGHAQNPTAKLLRTYLLKHRHSPKVAGCDNSPMLV